MKTAGVAVAQFPYLYETHKYSIMCFCLLFSLTSSFLHFCHVFQPHRHQVAANLLKETGSSNCRCGFSVDFDNISLITENTRTICVSIASFLSFSPSLSLSLSFPLITVYINSQIIPFLTEAHERHTAPFSS